VTPGDSASWSRWGSFSVATAWPSARGIRDWKARHLRRPPRGYHWVSVNGDYVLAAIATGVIADLLLNQ
jgi:Ni/Co efflux regulator RcnB